MANQSSKGVEVSSHPLRVAVIGAGPAGIYASDILSKSEVNASIDLYEKLPAPYGLVRYGVAPDHPAIKHIINALYEVLQRGDIRLVGNVEIGKDITFEELRAQYDAVIIATGADKDADFSVPGVDLPEVYGGADFVNWYEGHPDVPLTWPLEAQSVAVIGVGNVALDIARMLAKHSQDFASTDIPQNVEEALAKSPVREVHVFGRRGPAQAKFSPMELRELGQTPDVDVIVDEQDYQYVPGFDPEASESKITRQVVKILNEYLEAQSEEKTASRRVYIHMMQQPAEIIGDGHVEAIRMERTALEGSGDVVGTGEYVEYLVQAVYRATGYKSSPVPGVPFDSVHNIVPNVAGRVKMADGAEVRGLYATGWIKRGPVGLIGSTKSDAAETIASLVEDYQAGELSHNPDSAGWEGIASLLESRGVRFTNWQGWELLESYEKLLGEKRGRERTKIVDRDAMTAISRGEYGGKIK